MSPKLFRRITEEFVAGEDETLGDVLDGIAANDDLEDEGGDEEEADEKGARYGNDRRKR